MSIVTIRNVEFINNPAKFSDVYRFRVTFDCIASLKDDLEWKLIYVSSPGNEELDQELDDCLVGPVPSGVNSFEFEGSPPDPSKIPAEDVLGVAALILTGSYKDQEFVRVGYYQNTEYDNEEMKETPPANIMFHRLVRDISAKPRVTRFQIKWCVWCYSIEDATYGRYVQGRRTAVTGADGRRSDVGLCAVCERPG
ncbi:ASF1 like histone chaperone-domain-containing protein [Mycena sp. CBHHK59/15]|nr:ASF1 like histone chaperone-domain-containing protein [Mycena sp. CBHHK59/15]